MRESQTLASEARSPEMHGFVCPVLVPELIRIGRQPVPTAATRCYLIQMLRLVSTCTNGCSCWSPDERNSPQDFPYHGCALPTELGGRVCCLQLYTDIAAVTLMKGPAHRAPR